MKIVVIGGTGLIGSHLVAALVRAGHDALPASPSTGVDVASGAGLAEALTGAQIVVDVSKPRTYAPDAVAAYFASAAEHLVRAAADVDHLVTLAAVGTRASSPVPYYRAKAVGEAIVRAAGVPCTRVHATQFFEFAGAIADSASWGSRVLLPPALVQPVAGVDVADALAVIATEPPVPDGVQIAGPELLPLAEFVRRDLERRGDVREVAVDASARYFGGRIAERTLLPDGGARIGLTRWDDWAAAEKPSGSEKRHVRPSR